ncbi:putative ribonuclease H-like domain-containing protein [Tanacetum coccineum]
MQSTRNYWYVTSLKKNVDAGQFEENNVSTQQYIVFLLWSSISSSDKSSYETDEDDTADDAAGEKPVQKPASKNEQALKNVLDKMMDQEKEAKEQSDAVRKEFEAQCNRQNLSGKTTRASNKKANTNNFNTVSTPVNTAGASRIFGDVGSSFVPLSKFTNLPHDPLMPDLEDTAEVPNTGIFGSAYDDDDLDTCNSPYADQVVGAEADFNNMEPSTVVSPIPTTRVHSIHPKDQIIGDPRSAVQTRGMTKKSSGEHAMISYIQKQRRSNHKDFQNCLFACFLSQQEPTKIAQALDDESWVEAMQEELLQFKIQKVWTLVDLPYGKKAIGTKWVYRNKKVERGIVVRNKARLVAQGYKQKKGIDYDEVFAPIARIEAIRLFLAYASFMNVLVYQMDVKSAFLYSTIEEESLCTDFEQIMHKRFQMSSIGELTFFLGLQVKQKNDGIFISQDKYVGEILKKFGFSSIRTASTPMETNKALAKDEEGEDVDVHLYRSMIGSLMYLTSSRPDIMFSVCACSRFQVQPKVSHMFAVKRIFRYLKGRPKLGLWYPKDSPFILEAFLDSDYAGASLDRKSTTRGCQFLGSRLGIISLETQFPEKVYKVEKALYGLHQAPRAWYETLSTYLLDNGFYRGQIDKTLFIKRVKDDILLMSSMGELTFFLGLHVKQKEDGIFISQDKSMIGSLMYLTSSRPDIMFSVCACSRFQVQPKVSHLNAVKRIFRYLKGRPNLGLWLISWQCKKQTVVANSTTEAEYIAASHCCGQVLWIQNQMLDYGYNFMQTKIHVDNESAICVVKNPVYHSKTKHIEIRHHFIRDSYEKRLIEMVKIHTDNNVADLLTKAFDGRLMVFNCVERAITTAVSLVAAQDSNNIIRTQTTAMPNVDILQGMDTGGSPKRQDTIGGALAQTRSERVLEKPNEPPLSEGHTSRSREGRMEHQFELMANVLDLEKEKDAQVVEILRLKKRVKRLERQRKSSTSQPRRRKYRQVESSDDDLNEEDASKQGRRNDKTKQL